MFYHAFILHYTHQPPHSPLCQLANYGYYRLTISPYWLTNPRAAQRFSIF